MFKKMSAVIGTLAVALGVSFFLLKSQMNQRNYIDLSVQNPEVIVFYKDTCPTCQKLYPKIYLKTVRRLKMTVFVNLDAKKNRKYIKQYKLKKVPTVFNTKTKIRYAGADLKKIDRVIISSN